MSKFSLFAATSAIFMLILLSGIPAKQAMAQYYVVAGYNASCPTKFENLNFIVDQYNYTHPNLDEYMDHFNYFDGFTCAIGRAYSVLFAELGYTGATQTSKASYYDNAGYFITQQVRARMRTFDINIGLCTGLKEYNYFAVGMGISFGQFSVRSKETASYINSADWSRNLIKSEAGIFTYTFFVRYSPYGGYIWMQPYLSISPSKIIGDSMWRNMRNVNVYLNPGSFQNDPQDLGILFNSAGVKMCILIPYWDD